MFQFPAFALPALYIQAGVTGSLRPGFPIQKSADQRSFASFPQLIAGYHVFRRLSMPRHPPCTLSNLTTFIAARVNWANSHADPATTGTGPRPIKVTFTESGARR